MVVQRLEVVLLYVLQERRARALFREDQVNQKGYQG
jgi:hypothetical protein